MNSREHEAFTANGKAKISDKEGGAFSCHGGYVSGATSSSSPAGASCRAWRVKGMPEGVYSIARFELKKARAARGWCSTRRAASEQSATSPALEGALLEAAEGVSGEENNCLAERPGRHSDGSARSPR